MGLSIKDKERHIDSSFNLPHLPSHTSPRAHALTRTHARKHSRTHARTHTHTHTHTLTHSLTHHHPHPPPPHHSPPPHTHTHTLSEQIKKKKELVRFLEVKEISFQSGPESVTFLAAFLNRRSSEYQTDGLEYEKARPPFVLYLWIGLGSRW